MTDSSDALEALGGWPGVISRLVAGENLSADDAATAMGAILRGDATPAQLIAFSVAMRIKGETGDELTGLLGAVLDAAVLVPLGDELRDQAIDVVGTGGDGSHSINVSTMAAIVTAGAGVPVCKHGARSASSRCGTADVLEALGVGLELSPEEVVACVEDAGIGFCLAPRFHAAFRFAAPARREVGIPLMFNLLGPMANPGRVRRQLIGVADGRFAERMLDSLRRHGSAVTWVVHGDGLDELSTTGPSQVLALEPDGSTRAFTVDPADFGLPVAQRSDLEGGDAAANAAAVHAVLDGQRGPHRDIVVLNAGAALVIAGRVDGLADGIELASAVIDDGQAAASLDALVAVSNR